MGKINKLRTLLIFPPLTALPSDYPTPNSPLGLAYIAAVLEKHGFDVKILDAFAQGLNNVEQKSGEYIRVGMNESNIKSYLLKYNPSLVGISCAYTAHLQNTLEMAQIVKETIPHSVVMLGGAHATSEAELLLKNRNIDLVVMGEGEMTVLALAEVLQSGGDMTKVNGISIRVGERIIRTPPRLYIDNLDELPFPAWHLLPMKIYLESQTSTRSYTMRLPRANIITSRGCPYYCIFCSVHSIWGHKWRARSAENVIAEMEFLVEKYGIREFYILDDNITIQRKRVMEICNMMISSNLNVKWATPNGVAVWTLDKELLLKMKESGYYRLTLGIESAAEETLKLIGKPVNLQKANQIIKISNKIGLWTHSTFIFGFPDEQMSSIIKTINFAKESGLDFTSFYIATPYPGTKLYDAFQEYNLFNNEGGQPYNSQYSSITHAAYDTRYFTRQELDKLRNKAYNEFLKNRLKRFSNPILFFRHFWPKINSFEKVRYFLRLVLNVIAMNISQLKTGEIRTHKR